MKSHIFALLVLSGFFGCSTDDKSPASLVLASGVFAASEGQQVLSVYLTDNRFDSIFISNKDGLHFKVADFTSKGNWPKFEYTYKTNKEEFAMSVTFKDTAHFMADYSGAFILGKDEIIEPTMSATTLAMEGKGAIFSKLTNPLKVKGCGMADLAKLQIVSN